MSQFPLETIVAWAKRKGFVYPNSEIYGGLANAWDYGPYGSQLKKNIADLWINYFVTQRDDMVLMDTAIIANPQTWVASGHAGAFGDALIDDKKTNQRFRADKILEDWISKKNITVEFLSKYEVDNLIPESWGNEKMAEVIRAEIPNNPDTGKPAEWTDARQFNLMLQTQLGVIEDATAKAYLRPETCQSLFTNFKNLTNTTRMRVPFGMAQVGKAFRNEITPGQFLYRTREFEQMEIEYFVENDLEKSKEYFEMWKELSMKFWQEQIQLKAENLRFREHEKDELSFYSAGTFDVEYNYPRGWGELQGIANRTDYDLTQHQTVSKQDLQYHDPKTGARYIPYVIEPSFGLSRTVMAVMMDCYEEETLTKQNSDGSVSTDTRTVIRFPFQIAPVKYAILPLIEKNIDMVELGEKIFHKLKKQFNCEFDLGGAIGKRYRRQDEIGTPYCICVDHQSLEDGTVTIRDRDTMEQVRVKWEDIGSDR
ncbi:Glycine--tRNA ligase [candidate division SR1 bacterium Aalborg_AAW-1]|nr:Glycine--tRNA ligase [candidate division SR1 bacterium Aalborg_AAW-1]